MNEPEQARKQFTNTLGAFGNGPAANGPAQAMENSGFHHLPWPRKPVGKAGTSGKGSIGKHQSGGRVSRSGRSRSKKSS